MKRRKDQDGNNLNVHFVVSTFVLFLVSNNQCLRVYARCTLSKPATIETR